MATSYELLYEIGAATVERQERAVTAIYTRIVPVAAAGTAAAAFLTKPAFGGHLDDLRALVAVVSLLGALMLLVGFVVTLWTRKFAVVTVGGVRAEASKQTLQLGDSDWLHSTVANLLEEARQHNEKELEKLEGSFLVALMGLAVEATCLALAAGPLAS